MDIWPTIRKSRPNRRRANSDRTFVLWIIYCSTFTMNKKEEKSMTFGLCLGQKIIAISFEEIYA
jgi:hypothetical protein